MLFLPRPHGKQQEPFRTNDRLHRHSLRSQDHRRPFCQDHTVQEDYPPPLPRGRVHGLFQSPAGFRYPHHHTNIALPACSHPSTMSRKIPYRQRLHHWRAALRNRLSVPVLLYPSCQRGASPDRCPAPAGQFPRMPVPQRSCTLSAGLPG